MGQEWLIAGERPEPSPAALHPGSSAGSAPLGGARIAAAQKKRWARVRKAAKRAATASSAKAPAKRKARKAVKNAPAGKAKSRKRAALSAGESGGYTCNSGTACGGNSFLTAATDLR